MRFAFQTGKRQAVPDHRELSAVGGPFCDARVLPLIFLCVAGGLALPALVIVASNLSLHLFGAAAVATVLEIAQEPDSDGSGYVACPEFSFHAANGKEVLWQSRSCSNPSAWAQGERVRVFYYRSHPSYNVVDTFAQEWPRHPGLGGDGGTRRRQARNASFSENLLSRNCPLVTRVSASPANALLATSCNEVSSTVS